MKEHTIIKIFWVAAVIACACLLGYHLGTQMDCEKKGGHLARTEFGFICVKEI